MLYGDHTTDFMYIIFIDYVLAIYALDQSTKRKASARQKGKSGGINNMTSSNGVAVA